MDKIKPLGALKYHSIKIANRLHAVYYNVRFVDEDGHFFDG
ncbi:hypothetical protein LCGC14_2998830, partial [marine sediment metagenome]